MKRCPECRRDYYDDTLLQCLDDGDARRPGVRNGILPLEKGLSEMDDVQVVVPKSGTADHFALAEKEPR